MLCFVARLNFIVIFAGKDLFLVAQECLIVAVKIGSDIDTVMMVGKLFMASMIFVQNALNTMV